MNSTRGPAITQLPAFFFRRSMEWMSVCFPRETGGKISRFKRKRRRHILLRPETLIEVRVHRMMLPSKFRFLVATRQVIYVGITLMKPFFFSCKLKLLTDARVFSLLSPILSSLFCYCYQLLFLAPLLPCYNESRTQLFRRFNKQGYVIYSPEKNKENRAR